MPETQSAPTVSVVMAAYNTAAYIRAAVESILGQDFADFEFIIVDDGSTDGTSDTLRQYAAQDERIVLIRQPENQGYTRALNLGLGRARGRLLARQDADDVSLAGRLGAEFAFLERHASIGLVTCQVQIIGPDGGRLPVRIFDGGLDNRALQAELLDHNPICHGTVMIRRSCLDQVGHYNEAMELTEDYDLWLRLAEITELAKLPDRLYQYRHHPESVSHVRKGAQMVAQGRTLEQAMRRRHGARASGQHLRSAAEAFRMAATIFLQQGDDEAAGRYLSQAMRLSPELFADVNTFVPVPDERASERLAFLERALAELPPTRPYRRLGRLLRGRHHMRLGFAAARRGHWPAVRKQLWLGLTADPSWLRNRGIWVLAGKALRYGWGRAAPADQSQSEGETI